METEIRKTGKWTKQEVAREALSWVLWLAGAVALALIVNNTVIVNAEVISGSMETTINIGDRVIGNRLSYLFSEPERLDIIVFRWPDNRDEKPFVKRIIGLPGETVNIVNGKVYINDSETPLDESEYLHEEWVKHVSGTFVVPEDSYFVMGDNRNDSNDSRLWINKYVPKKDILGKVFMRLFPNTRLFG